MKEGMGWDAPIKSYPDSPMIIKYAQVFKFYTNKCDLWFPELTFS